MLKIIAQIKDGFNKLFGRTTSFFDRDKFKNSISPDSDWEHVIIFIVMLIIFLAFLSGYLYLSVDQKTVTINSIKLGEKIISKDRVINAVSAINREKEGYDLLIAKPPKLEDPSK